MRIRRPWHALAIATTVALSLFAAGCGEAVEDNPKNAFVDAVRALGDEPGATVTARLVADAGNIAAVAESEGDPVDVGDVEKVLDSSLAVSWHEGDDADDPDDDQGQMVVNIDGSDDVEVRYDGQDLYLRGDVRRLMELSDDAPSAEDAESFLAELEAGGFDFARAAYEGRWLRLVGMEQAQSFFEGLADGGAEDSPDTTEQAERVAEAAQSALRDLLRDEVEVAHVGSDSVGDKVVASVTVSALAEAFIEILEAQDMGTGYWAPDPDLLREELAAASYADEVIEVEAWIAGGSLRQLRLDVVGLVRQFDEHGDVPAELDAVHLELEFTEFRDGVSVPDDAVEIDLFELMGQSLGGMGSGFGDLHGGEPAPDAESWAPSEDGAAAPHPGDDADGAPPEDGAGGDGPGPAQPGVEEPDWENMTDDELDEWMQEFEDQFEEESAAN